ncbi:YsnF/AvaK domain-containing protein [Rhizobium sp. LjRoot98]|uniref:YsnF/AvaK domain-containing protein n=1 Tax=Rhizobium sp. LjRoot98 TaxID=3342345 RepID=UPI003ECC9EFF
MAYNETENGYSTASGTSSALTAFFDSRADADSAIERLEDAGVSSDAIRLVPGYEADGDNETTAADDRKGFWESLGDFFFPDKDRLVYSEGLRRGGFLVSVTLVGDTLYETAHEILDEEGSIDIDERADTWRNEGWNDYISTSSTSSTSTYDASRASLGTASDDAFVPDTTDHDTIKVVEENLRVGKRDVNAGSVKVRSYTIETPVSEDISLRDENVTIERRTVDRPLSDADAAFQERTISAEERHEEAVVSKEARGAEEIGINKTSTERTETVSDSVRKTEVEVADQRIGTQKQDGFSQSQGFKRT